MAYQISIQFFADLNFFLRSEQRERPFLTLLYPPVTIKHIIESLGVPHTEVEAIVCNGRSIPFTYLAQPDDSFVIYPPSTLPNGIPIVPLREQLTDNPRFILDNHLGKLARYLRLLGFDTLYPRDHLPDAKLAQMAHDQQRVMLTRDRGLLMRNIISHGYCLQTKDGVEQLTAVLRRYQLHGEIRPWTRCLRCNGFLQTVPKTQIIDRLQPKTKRTFNEFQICIDCEQIYWKGSHFEALESLVGLAQAANVS
ncbi:MAG: twitching motility protein PilT [Chloroflexi bacterium]|nr:MAG: twitching motility protein PilT [Chloroflexota bacterium]